MDGLLRLPAALLADALYVLADLLTAYVRKGR